MKFKIEIKYIKRCLELARLGKGNVSPNPMVGAVIVYNNKIIGEGYHQQYGKAHAEVNAINVVISKYPDSYQELMKESTMYVSLEPCSHFGKTPPCADLIIRHQIPRVVIGAPDPFDPVNGKGVQKLKDAGIEVIENFGLQECSFLNRRFFTRVTKQRPYIILKWAQTADSYFAPMDRSQKWISGFDAKILSHVWRTEEDAVLVGKTTALMDNPQLNVRLWNGRNPVRIVIDKNLELTDGLALFDQSQETIVFNAVKTEYKGKIKYLQIEEFDLYLVQMIAYQLYLMDIQSVIVEGGIHVINQFIEADLWDEARIFKSSQLWQEGIKAPSLTGSLEGTIQIGPDSLVCIFNK
ncbi:bifunctional diaminohydroxyphosphoribosylaminopyrimidine deaminase/5-amino-6-(5-phosphoribosylamino)uracil reductase RibD [Arcticibacter eurypsychrophilus]|uniref:bifunctional diaminohydroxyphosphoribosylaminopyrimidine deaminase/5-amino-6-(5-phosphoribosylamino)uracil reductase RibD n=1 Tax=Arcticibacter eurypsychrophilus TaxID=1434752 RepID=UPI00084CFBD8|nr:bifunctional diaminohydroxyphosphoribosylaminopyrimidine deaminase/5-amino-6-(5-phosphoribosylamino)uracil reductase RibD [Arcticibacter eurypsychrophilus]